MFLFISTLTKLCSMKMIEYCNKKKMALAVFLLISLSVILLILKSVWASGTWLEMQRVVKNNRTCREADISSTESCNRCSKDELRAEVPVCSETGYKQIASCKDGSQFWKSCEITPAMDEKNYWIFFAINILVGLTAYIYVRRRQKVLDGVLMEKINKQLSSGL